MLHHWLSAPWAEAFPRWLSAPWAETGGAAARGGQVLASRLLMNPDPEALGRARTLRKAMSPPEAALWTWLRDKRLNGLKFRRQHPLGPYVLDFYCDAARLAVEIDGGTHHTEAQAAHDRRRDRWLAEQGVRALRLSAEWVRRDMAGLLEHIVRAANAER